MPKDKIQQNIELLQGFYRFLYLGKFLEKFIKQKNISTYAVDSPIQTGDKKNFVLKGIVVKKILSDIYSNPDKKNIFGYMVEINSFRGIFSVTREMIEVEESFQIFLDKKLKDKAFAFGQIIRFMRNILNHIETADVKLKIEDFINQKTFLLKEKKISKIKLDIKYADYFVEWKGGKDYGLDIEIDFGKLKEGQKIFDIISLHQVYLLAEFCFNISEIFRSIIRTTETNNMKGNLKFKKKFN